LNDNSGDESEEVEGEKHPFIVVTEALESQHNLKLQQKGYATVAFFVASILKVEKREGRDGAILGGVESIKSMPDNKLWKQLIPLHAHWLSNPTLCPTNNYKISAIQVRRP